MNNSENPMVKAVQECVLNLLELVEQAGRTEAGVDIESLREEAQKTALMMIAAIVLSDRKYDDGERAFVGALVNSSQKDGGEARHLNEYAERWKAESLQVPRFFHLAVEHDVRHQTDLARGMMREIQLIGNNTCATDGCFEPTEHQVVRNYISLMEEYLTAWQAQHPARSAGNAEGWTSV